jgi:hypothetical protein
MKKIFFLSFTLALLIFVSCGDNKSNKASTNLVDNPVSANDTNASAADNAPIMTFSENIHDFGKLTDGEVVTYKFKFTNTGKSDLIIANATASCGCTVPSYPKEPIAPGAEASIDVQFNSEGKVGVFDKSVTIVANTIPSETILAIKGEVLKK